MLLLLPEVAEPVKVAPLCVPGAAVSTGPGQSGGAGHLAQGVGLLGGRGLVAPGDWSVDISVWSRHHSELLSLSHYSHKPSNLHQPWWSLFTNMSRKLGAPITCVWERPLINLLSVFAESYHQILIHKLVVRYFNKL